MKSSVTRLFDGLTSLVAGLGTGRDKSTSLFYTADLMTDADAFQMYEGSALARNIVDYPAVDSCREWRDWNATAEQITLLEDEEERLQVQVKVLQARKWARLFGGSAILIGTGETDLMQELRPDRILKSGIKYLTVLDKTQLTAGELVMDPASEYFGRPVKYTVTNTAGANMDIHVSRLVIFYGQERPLASTYNVDGWGSSVLNSTQDSIKQADGTAANIASLVFEAKIDIISIPDLMERLRDPRYEEQLQQRFGLAMRMKGINGTLLLDANETYEQKSPELGNLSEIMMSFMQVVSGASRIPATRLLGQAPQGMNSTGEGDYKNYLDWIKAEQRLFMSPAMRVLDECLIRSALGNRPPEIFYEWAPLWNQSEKEKADIFKAKADAARVLVGSAAGQEIIPREAVSESIINAFIEDGSLPGLEKAMETFGPIGENLPDPNELAAANGNTPPGASVARAQQAVADAVERPLYVYRKVLNAEAIIAWAKSQGFTSTLAASDLHVTITYSRKPVDWFKMGSTWDDTITVPRGGARLIEQFGQAVVLLFASNSLVWRHNAMVEEGASWDHPEYQPHVTISYEGAPADLSAVKPYQGEIVLGPEMFEALNEDWQSTVEEV